MIVNSKPNKENESTPNNLTQLKSLSGNFKPQESWNISDSLGKRHWDDLINHPSIKSSYRKILRGLLKYNIKGLTPKKITKYRKHIGRSKKQLAKSTIKKYQKSIQKLQKVIKQKDIQKNTLFQRQIGSLKREISLQQIDIQFYNQRVKIQRKVLQADHQIFLMRFQHLEQQRKEKLSEIAYERKLRNILLSYSSGK